jgi:head-tail adaptor
LLNLPHRILIQQLERLDFQGGCATESWTTSSVEWANVQYNAVLSNETYDQDKKQQDSIYEAIMRQDVTLTNKNRIIFNGNILVVEDEGDPTCGGRMKKIKCRLENT